MKKNLGLWIDHRKAVILTLGQGGGDTVKIESMVEKKPHRAGEAHAATPYGRQEPRPDDLKQSSLTGHLGAYFDRVIAGIRGADSILIFGPGEAKGELMKRLTKKRLAGRIAGVESADRMSDGQIEAKIRRYFLVQGRAGLVKKTR